MREHHWCRRSSGHGRSTEQDLENQGTSHFIGCFFHHGVPIFLAFVQSAGPIVQNDHPFRIFRLNHNGVGHNGAAMIDNAAIRKAFPIVRRNNLRNLLSSVVATASKLAPLLPRQKHLQHMARSLRCACGRMISV
jgi:hypothetical protein